MPKTPRKNRIRQGNAKPKSAEAQANFDKFSGGDKKKK